MSLQGLPHMLQSLLANILDNHQVSSWNIRGGNVFSEVTIRFNMAAASDDIVKYRKVPPSRLTRDMQRAKRLPVTVDTASQAALDDSKIGDSRFEDNDHCSLDISTDHKRIQDIAADQGYSMEPVNTNMIDTPIHSPLGLVQLDGPVDRRSGSHSHDTGGRHDLHKQTMNTSESSTASVSMQQESILSHWQSVQELMNFGASTFKNAGKVDGGNGRSDNDT